MPLNTIWKREEFSLATLEGHECGLCHVALDITYEDNGDYTINGAGFVYHSEIERIVNGRVTWRDSIAWFQDTDDLTLEARIIARARAHYLDDIEDHVHGCIRDDNADGWGDEKREFWAAE